MYGRNYAFDPPRDENIKTWRYMSFAKFMSLIDRSEIFFARPDTLGDPFEGSYSRLNIVRGDKPRRERSWIARKLRPEPKFRWVTESSAPLRQTSFELAQKMTFVNCWHMNDYESAAMWAMYARRGEGIAVQSTYKHLRDCFSIPKPGYNVTIGVVKYIDYENDHIPEWNMSFRYLHKRKSFAYESELRAITMQPAPAGLPVISASAFPNKPGVYIEVDLKTLIDAIYVAPASPDWFKELVESMVRRMEQRYGFGRIVPVVRSDLDAPALV